ncbi:hypothetical protein GBA52_020614 [Prunus armeniaca]|nr:hypothetical protein GBA52_020614 [Prunus armeniaca]
MKWLNVSTTASRCYEIMLRSSHQTWIKIDVPGVCWVRRSWDEEDIEIVLRCLGVGEQCPTRMRIIRRFALGAAEA